MSVTVQKIEARYADEITREDIIALFKDNPKAKQGTMFRDDPDSLMNSWETNKLLEINIELTNKHQITCFYGEETVYIDLCSDTHIGLGNTVIYNEYKEIKSIEIKWR